MSLQPRRHLAYRSVVRSAFERLRNTAASVSWKVEINELRSQFCEVNNKTYRYNLEKKTQTTVSDIASVKVVLHSQ